MKSSHNHWWAFVALWFLSAATQADVNARVWLERMTSAAHTQNYSGVIVYGDPKQWDSFFVRHALIDGVEYEQLNQLTGEPVEFLRQGDTLQCAHEHSHKRHHLPLKNPLRTSLPHADLDQHYDFVMGERKRMAGRMAQQIVLLPRDEHRYGMSLWLDQDTALLLRSDLFNAKRVVLERAQFSHIEIGQPMTAAQFTLQLPAHPLTISALEPLKIVSWAPYWIPDGFKPLYANEDQGTVRLMYGDGLSVVSIYIEAADDDFPAIHNQLGATNALVRRVEYEGAVRRVTAVGELPLPTLVNIVQSVQPVALDLGEPTADE